MKSETLEILKKQKHNALRNLLSQCTIDQQNIFNKMYGSIDDIPENRWDWAICQCENTLKKGLK